MLTYYQYNIGYGKNRHVFLTETENEPVNYLMQVSNIYFGLSQKEIRMLACRTLKQTKHASKVDISNKAGISSW